MTRFYVSKAGQQSGPFTDAEVKSQLQSGSISKSDLFRPEGSESWLPLSDFPGAAHEDSRGCVRTAVVLIVLAMLMIGGCRFCRRTVPSEAKPAAEQPGPATPPPITAIPSTPPALEARATPKPPSYEDWFIQSVRQWETGLPAEITEARMSYIRSERRLGISNSLPGVLTISGWTGTLRKVQPTIDGRLAIAIELPDSNILLQTWGDALSDAGAGTLIEQKSELYGRLRSLAIGTPVSFDGEFLKDKDDWVKEGSKTVREGMASPKFIVHFTDVKGL